MVRKVNSILEKLIKSETNIDIIDNDNIRSEYHLNSSGLHLNQKGDRCSPSPKLHQLPQE